MRNITLRKINYLVAIALVVALVVSFCVVFNTNYSKNITAGNGGSAEPLSDFEATLRDTNGTIPDNTELVIPEGYTGVEIVDEVTLKAFLENADRDTLLYGYLNLEASETKSIDLTWATIGSTVILYGNKVLDGRGFSINLTTVGAMGYSSSFETVTPGKGADNRDIRAGGWFVAANYATIKNVTFNYAQKVEIRSNVDWTSSYGVITGYSAGTMDNVKLNITGQLNVDKKTPGSNSTDVNIATLIVGGFAGILASGTTETVSAGTGIVSNSTIHMAEGSQIYAHSRHKGGTFTNKGNARSSIGGITGRMQGVDTRILNVVATGNGTIKAYNDGNGGKNLHYRNLGIIAGANSAYSGTQNNEFGIVDGVINVFKGTITNSTSGDERHGAIVDCGENIYNAFMPGVNATDQYYMNCGCTHNKQSIYSIIALKGTQNGYEYGFSNDSSKLIEYSLNLTDAEIAREAVVNIHEKNIYKAEEFAGEIQSNTKYTVLADNYRGNIIGSLDKYTDRKADRVNLYYQTSVDVAVNQAAPSKFTYNGGSHFAGYKMIYKDNTEFVYDPTKIIINTTQNGNMVEGGAVLPGSYVNYVVAVDDNAYAYYDIDKMIFADDNSPSMTNIEIIKGNIATNVADGLWKNSFAYTLDTTGYVEAAVDGLDYSTDGGITWHKGVTGIVYNLNVSSANALGYSFRGRKGDVVVTNKFDAGTVLFDNIAPSIKDLMFDQLIENWVASDINAEFEASDSHSQIARVELDGVALTQVDGRYKFVMSDNVVYTITIADNAGNVITNTTAPKIDKVNPTITGNLTYLDSVTDPANPTNVEYTGGATALDITAHISATIGVSGGKVQFAYKDADGSLGTFSDLVYASLADITKVFNSNMNKSVVFKVVNGTGAEAIYETVVINIDKSNVLVVITDANITKTTEILEKVYDKTLTSTATAELKDLVNTFGGGNTPLTAEQIADLKVVIEYGDYNVNENATLKYKVVAIANADYYVIDNQITDTTNGKITKASLSLKINNTTKQYGMDNPTESYSVTGLMSGDSYEPLLINSGDKSSVVGNYAIDIDSAFAETANYIVNVTKGEMIVTARKVTVVYENYNGIRYDGTPKSISAYYADITGEKVYLTCNYGDVEAINAGKYTASAIITDVNYVNANPNGTFVFTIFKGTPIITAMDANVNYNGTAQGFNYSISGDLPATVKYNGSLELPTNAGKYLVLIEHKSTDNGNYSDAYAEFVFTINKIAYSDIVFEGKVFVTNGMTHSLEVTGLPDGTVVNYTSNDKVEPGIYNVVAKLVNKNYIDKELTAVLEIKKAIMEGIFLANSSIVYDGLIHGLTLVDEDGNAIVLPEGTTVVWFNNDKINVDVYNVKAVVSREFYQDLVLEAMLTITLANIKGITFVDTEYEYDGVEHTIVVTGADETYSVKYVRNKGINASNYFSVATISKPNYHNLVLTANMLITAVEVDIIYEGIPKSHKAGDPLPEVKAYFQNVNGDRVDILVTVKDNTEKSKTLTLTPDFKGSNNYIASSDTSAKVVKVNTGMSTGAIIGVSVGGGVGGMVAIGGIFAVLFVLKKKRSII